MRRTFLRVIGCALVLAATIQAQDVARRRPGGVPFFEVDKSWPKLPANMKLGMLMGLAVDSHDHVWLLHRPGAIPEKDKAQAGPPVIELDDAGNYVQGWGGPGAGYEWPLSRHEHGIFVDYKDNVWICSAGVGPNLDENQILKFTKTGKFLMQIGHRGKSQGSNDPENFRGPADVWVDPKTNEAYVADGYGNHRVIVFDADTGAFKRLWGAYGSKPDDKNAGSPDNLTEFGIVHQAIVSNDGRVYVADHSVGRVQVFTTAGKFIRERELSRFTKPRPGTTSLAFSHDPQQKYLYVADLRRWVIDVLLRETLESVDIIGNFGDMPGQFQNPHNMATDSKGNLYVGDMGFPVGGAFAGRAQKFVLQP
jgi:DNA-binding beta-propeller fold protein YncE